MQLTGRPPVGVVFDCDMGARPDTALALSLLFALDQKNECRAAGLATSRTNLASAAFMEAIYRHYFGFSPFLRALAVGMAMDGPKDDLPALAGPIQSFKHTVEKLADTADPYAVIRNAFTAQYDGNAATVLCGPATNLAKVLDLPGARGWIERKCRLLVAALTPKRVEADPAAAKKVLAEWPGPIVLCDVEFQFPLASVPASHPVTSLIQSNIDANDCAAVLAAVRPLDTYFTLVDKKLALDPAKQPALLEAVIELANAKPQPRSGPPRRPPA